MSTLRRVRAFKKPIMTSKFLRMHSVPPLLVEAVTAIDWKPTWERYGDAATEKPFVPSRNVSHGERKRERVKSPSVGRSRKM